MSPRYIYPPEVQDLLAPVLIVLNEPVGNLGAVQVCKLPPYIRNIGKIRKFRNTDTIKSAIVSPVTSRLDYCNGLLCGITDELLCRLQKVQNNAARVVSGSKKYNHITPVLKDLHWLPIRKKIIIIIIIYIYIYIYISIL